VNRTGLSLEIQKKKERMKKEIKKKKKYRKKTMNQAKKSSRFYLKNTRSIGTLPFFSRTAV